MTIAIDIRTGAIVGQVTATGYACTPDGRATGDLQVRLLTDAGYVNRPLSSVRLEELR